MKPRAVALTWRYDSGLVVSGVPDSDAALTTLNNAQQTTIGLSCGRLVASFNNGLGPDDCTGKVVKSTLLTLPQAGQENDDHNPDRVKARHVFLGDHLKTDQWAPPWTRICFTASAVVAATPVLI